ncbi:NERD domain-containing protein [Luteimonas viscosa]|uniref:NERD domain-containing protein n=2 Tax=Luteimonas viscosa TaxID=1132694 RepID=A0A5D4XWU1_9GAMM|nr:NERD domain-containing protein [Luteimonas viscosa]
MMVTSLPLMFMIWLTFRVRWQEVQVSWVEAMFLVGALVLFGWGLTTYIRHYRARERVRDGWTAEQVTGLQLNRLMVHGCLVLHDLPADGFNIDHVVVAPRGVYAVETKSFRKPQQAVEGENYRVSFDGRALRFPDFVEAGAPAQAERYAGWLDRALRDAGFDVPVIPALALPGWLIDQAEETWRSAKVKVFSPMGNGASFMAKNIVRIDAAQRSAIAQALALRFPKIEG